MHVLPLSDALKCLSNAYLKMELNDRVEVEISMSWTEEKF